MNGRVVRWREGEWEGGREAKLGWLINVILQLNTFQCVLATDGLYSFIMFLYPKGGIQWTAGDTHGRNGK